MKLCSDVLHTVSDVLWSLPPLSLSNETAIPHLGRQSLADVTGFLETIVTCSQNAHTKSKAVKSCR